MSDDREKLINEAASIVYDATPASVIVPWDELHGNRRVEFEDAARAILAVLEKEIEAELAELEELRDHDIWYGDDL